MRLVDPNQTPVGDLADTFTPLNDEKRTFKGELKKMKSLGFKAGVGYFMDYYKWPVILIIAAIIAVISITHSVILNSRPYIISGSIYNNYTETDEEIFYNNYADYLGLNLNDYQLYVGTSGTFDPTSMDETTYNTLQKIMAEIASRGIDFLGGDKRIINYFSDDETDNVVFADLEEVLPDDLKEALQDKFFYVTDQNKRRFAAAVDISGTRVAEELGLLLEPCYVGMIINTQRPEAFFDLLRYAFD